MAALSVKVLSRGGREDTYISGELDTLGLQRNDHTHAVDNRILGSFHQEMEGQESSKEH